MKTKGFTIFLLMLMMFYTNNSLASEGHDDDSMDESMDDHSAVDQCSTPTVEVTITGGENQDLVYDKTEYNVAKNTCVKILFVNVALIEHDVSIDAVEGSLEKVHIHLANNKDGDEADGIKSLHILTPDFDTEFDIYCSVAGHKSAGMVAKLIVGQGNSENNSLPGFGLFASLFAISTLIATFRLKKII